MSKREHYLWVEKYRPHTIGDLILPDTQKGIFQSYVDGGNIPNLLLYGTSGVGKTTAAKALCDSLGADYIVINGSNEGRSIDTLRTQIQEFSSTVSFDGGRKYVILDEADYLNPTSFQPALRNFMEEFSRNTGFILTCNYKEKIIPPLQSRCSTMSFKIVKADIPKMASQFMKRCMYILDTEGVTYHKEVLAKVVTAGFPDYRSILNTLQKYARLSNTIDVGILAIKSDSKFSELFDAMKRKDFSTVRKWITEVDCDPAEFFTKIYDESSKYLAPHTMPLMTLIIAKYMYQDSFVANPEINLAACAAELMVECEFI